MTQEQIEKAADKYAEAHDVEPYDEYGSGIRIGARFGFIAGAKWRINSVWHDRTKSASMDNGEIIFVFSDGSAMTKSVLGWNWEDIQEHFKFVKWAYMKDLLPTEE